MVKNGFVLLSVVLICFIISFGALSYWRHVSICFDIALEREKYYKRFYLTELLLNYGIAYSKENFLLLENEPKEFNISDLLRVVDRAGVGRLKISKNKRGLLISVRLVDKEDSFELSCLLIRKRSEKFIVERFSIGSVI